MGWPIGPRLEGFGAFVDMCQNLKLKDIFGCPETVGCEDFEGNMFVFSTWLSALDQDF